MTTATAQAHPNIAFIKYWGNRDSALRIPSNGSISMNLGGLFTRTTVSYQPSLALDELVINGHEVAGKGLLRVSAILDEVRRVAGLRSKAEVISENNFPSGAGIASSASAFAALAVAATRAAGLEWSERELSVLARPGGFVEWFPGEDDEGSFAVSIAPPDHWDLADCVAILTAAHKPTGSTEGHALAPTSPLQAARVEDAPRRLDVCRRAVLERNFEALAGVVEQDSDLMHAVMMTSHPALFYWEPATLAVMQAVRAWRAEGLPVCYTVDAGANVHVICAGGEAARVEALLLKLPGVTRVLTGAPGGPAVVL